jgi:hypothetical protein
LIYFAQAVEGGPVKIGFSTNVEARVRQLEKHYGRQLAVLATLPGGLEEEAAIHERFDHLRLKRKNDRGRHPEQFRPAADLMVFIERPLLVGANADAVEAMDVERISLLRNILVLRGTEEWKVWLDGLATANSAPLTVTVEQALKEYANKIGYSKPPKRVP